MAAKRFVSVIMTCCVIGLPVVGISSCTRVLTTTVTMTISSTTIESTTSSTIGPTVTSTIEPTTTGPTTTTTAVPTMTSTQSINGLQLQVSVSASDISPGEPFQISISEYNALGSSNNVSAEKNWGVNGLALGNCPNIYVQPFGVAVYQGYYTAQNISQANPLKIFMPGVCPNYVILITGYVFRPYSNYADILPDSNPTSGTPMSATVTVNGVYNLGTQSSSLSRGTYTVVAGDEWGALEFLYVTVE